MVRGVWPSRFIAFAILMSLCLFAGVASAKDSVATLSKRLKDASDFRVRTQAALALGASKSEKAVGPLCRGLEDSNTTVRAASAAGLGRLKLGGKSCLEKRLKDERSSAVKSSIKRALSHIDGGDGPTITKSTEVYLSIGKATDKTGRKSGAVDSIVRTTMSKAAAGMSGYAVAPARETTDEAKKLLSKYPKTKAFYLSPKVQKPDYSGGNLTIRFEIAIFTYPGKALKGMVPVKLTQQDVSKGDTSAESELIKMAAERAMEKFSKNVGRID
jgi:hypothetical protein